jgi:hypothetical protein
LHLQWATIVFVRAVVEILLFVAASFDTGAEVQSFAFLEGRGRLLDSRRRGSGTQIEEEPAVHYTPFVEDDGLLETVVQVDGHMENAAGPVAVGHPEGMGVVGSVRAVAAPLLYIDTVGLLSTIVSDRHALACCRLAMTGAVLAPALLRDEEQLYSAWSRATSMLLGQVGLLLSFLQELREEAHDPHYNQVAEAGAANCPNVSLLLANSHW